MRRAMHSVVCFLLLCMQRLHQGAEPKQALSRPVPWLSPNQCSCGLWQRPQEGRCSGVRQVCAYPFPSSFCSSTSLVHRTAPACFLASSPSAFWLPLPGQEEPLTPCKGWVLSCFLMLESGWIPFPHPSSLCWLLPVLAQHLQRMSWSTLLSLSFPLSFHHSVNAFIFSTCCFRDTPFLLHPCAPIG